MLSGPMYMTGSSVKAVLPGGGQSVAKIMSDADTISTVSEEHEGEKEEEEEERTVTAGA